MARRPFGGTAADVAADRRGNRVPGATATLWTARTGGTQLTDLQNTAGTALAGGVIVADGDGVFMWLGPADGTAVGWLDGGGGDRSLTAATDLPGRVKYLEDNGGGGGGGAVASVNGHTGVVVLVASDVGADAAGAASAAQAAAISTAATDATTKANAAQAAAATDATAKVLVETNARVTAAASKADLVAGVIPTAQLPALALTTAVPVANQAAMLALTTSQVQPGDIAVRADGAGSFILTAADPSVLGNWLRINAPTDAVTSVNGQTGTVVLSAADVGADTVAARNTAIAAASATSAPVSAAWASGVSYTVGQLVSNAGLLYSVSTAHTSSGSIDLAKFTAVAGTSVAATDIGYDVILLAGQSNMSGAATSGPDSRLDPSPVAGVYVYPASGSYANTIASAVDPLGHPDASTGTSPGMEFGRWYARQERRRVLLVPVAWNGTAFEGTTTRTWKTTRTDVPNLYAAAVDQALAALSAAGPNSRFAGILWHQGESDGTNGTTGATYQTDLDALVDAFRAALTTPTLPFVIGGMVPEYISGARTAIDAVQSGYPTHKAYTAYFAGPTGENLGDGNHYTQLGVRLLGRSYYNALIDARANSAATGGTSVTLKTAPQRPTSVAAVQGTGQVSVSWTAPTSLGGAALTDYTVQYRPTGNGAWTTFAHTAGTATTRVITGTTDGQAYQVRVAAVTSAGTSAFTVPVATTVATSISDTFTRADNASSLGTTEVGSKTWSVIGTATFGVSSNQAYAPAVSAPRAFAVVDTGSADFDFSVTLSVAANGMGACFRAADINNVWFCNQTAVAKTVGGGTSVLGSFTSQYNSGDVLRVTGVGNVITFYKNGSVNFTVTDSALAGNTKVGLKVDPGDTSVRWDSFSVV